MNRWEAICPSCKKSVAMASGKFATHNKPNSFDICKNSRNHVELCGAPGMIPGETCVLAKGHDGDAPSSDANAKDQTVKVTATSITAAQVRDLHFPDPRRPGHRRHWQRSIDWSRALGATP